MKRTSLAILAALLTMASTSFAATQTTNASTISPTLNISATIQDAISLTLQAGSLVGHCVLTPGAGNPDYSMNFGTVDALGVNAGNCKLFAPTTPGVTPAIYWTDYALTPMYTSQALALNTVAITAQVTTDFSANPAEGTFIVRDTANSNAVPTVAGFTKMGVASADTIASGNSAAIPSGTAITRYVGVEVTPVNGANAITGAKTGTVTYTLTVN